MEERYFRQAAMGKVTEYLILSAAFMALNCKGQPLYDQMNFRTGDSDGARIYGVSVFSGYSTSAYPLTQGLQPGAPTIGADVNYGASASMGLQRHREWMDFSVIYSPSFIGQAHYSNLNSVNHTLLLNASRKWGSKWTASLSGSGQDISLTEFLFSPSSLAVRSQAPMSFDDLAAAFAVGQFTNSQVASMLTGAYPPTSPAQNLIYGYRTLSYSGQASLVYAYSHRLSFQVSSFASGSQPISNGSQAPGNYLVNHMIGANGGVNMSYSLSPRTQLGVNLNETWQINHYQGAYISTATVSIGRKMGEHWFATANAGYYTTREAKQGAALPTNQVIGGGSLGWKTYRQTFTASYNRNSTDSSGLIGTVTNIGGNWSWHHPGGDWSFLAGFSEEQTRNTGFVSLSGWQASSGITRKINNQSMLTAQYVFFTGSSTYNSIPTKLTVHSVRLSVGWSPQIALR
jgi:hypothetical protein